MCSDGPNSRVVDITTCPESLTSSKRTCSAILLGLATARPVLNPLVVSTKRACLARGIAIGTPASARTFHPASNCVKTAVPRIALEFDTTVAYPVTMEPSLTDMNLRLSPLPSSTTIALVPSVTLFPISSTQLDRKGVPSDFVNMIVALPPPDAVALLRKIVVIQPGPTATWGK